MVGNNNVIPDTFRRRRISRKRFKRLLWNNTITATKYKSYLAQSGTTATPASLTSATVGAYFAAGISNHAYEPFWTVNGGLTSLSQAIGTISDPTESSPTFNSDIVIRGGTLTLTICNNTETADANNDIVEARVLLIKTGPNWTANKSYFENAVIPGVSLRGITRDEKSNLGYICLEKAFLIKDGESATVNYRLPCQKINVGDYMNERYAYLWYTVVANKFVATAQSCSVMTSHNITFCGDTVS